MDKSILLTGANGFVGRALAANLVQQGASLTCAVRRPFELEGACMRSISNIDGLMDWSDCLSGIDTIIHAAARAHIVNGSATGSFTEFRRVNVDGALNFARQAADAGVKRFVFISSIGVNGAETFGTPFSELSFPQPHADYALSKLEAEEGLKLICAETGMKFVIIRPTLVYGSNAPGNFGRLLKLVHKGWLFPLGLVRNQRSMLALDNLVDFIKVCIEHPQAANHTFLVADGESVSTPQLIRLLSKGMGKPERLFPLPIQVLKLGASLLGKQSMYQQLCGSLQVDISKAQSMLGWVPPVRVDDGLRLAAKGYLNEKII